MTRQCSHLIENFVNEHFEGKKFSNCYEIYEKKRLGKGSYGSVYLCKHLRTGDQFACKVISLNKINSHYLRKLHLEIAVMKEINHPQIVQLREVFFGSRTVYLVMELCQGGEIHEIMSRYGRNGLPEEIVAKYLVDMLSALKYLHSKGIMHRDLKLENFLLDQRIAENASIKLVDFGLSKHFTEHEIVHQMVGSAYYTAPEVISGSYDQRCDIWSLGVIAFIMLTGCPPFDGNSCNEIHKKIMYVDVDFNSKILNECSIDAKNFVKRLLTKSSDERISLDDALNHSFIINMRGKVEAASKTMVHKSILDSDNLNDLVDFMNSSRARQLMMKMIAFSLNPAEISQLRNEFHALDIDKSGCISIGALQRSLKLSLPTSVLRQHSEQIDNISSNETLNYNEFVAAAMCKRISIDEERLHVAFESLDTQSTGHVTASSIRDILGDDLSEDVMKEIAIEMNCTHDGYIECKEFLKYWRKIMIKNHVTPLQKLRGVVNKVVRSLRIMKALVKNKDSHV